MHFYNLINSLYKGHTKTTSRNYKIHALQIVLGCLAVSELVNFLVSISFSYIAYVLCKVVPEMLEPNQGSRSTALLIQRRCPQTALIL